MVNAGDKVVVQVWNANLPISASWCLVAVAAAGSTGSYDCRAGGSQVAFNWGPHYA